MKKGILPFIMHRPLLLAVTFVSLAAAAFGASFAVAQAVKEPAATNDPCAHELCVALTADGIKPDTVTVEAGSYVRFNSADSKTHNLSPGGGSSNLHGSVKRSTAGPTVQLVHNGEVHEEKKEHNHTEAFSSGDIGPDEAWRVQFKQPGTYVFHDHYNPALTVLVVVYEPAKPSRIQ